MKTTTDLQGKINCFAIFAILKFSRARKPKRSESVEHRNHFYSLVFLNRSGIGSEQSFCNVCLLSKRGWEHLNSSQSHSNSWISQILFLETEGYISNVQRKKIVPIPSHLLKGYEERIGCDIISSCVAGSGYMMD